ncbi:hypothetical protein KAFR_0F01060 [Kazachstania africana CBS 2517]|uniref:Uncharacterized protein n=1 Tax=Kazachstania africana (strain ATCC 22294 / BCRC 22015 / CBS 2517 / CECT 1963 / NBRC 1671 / NRRL Y-8276) TaxID=1071382 RepID=H2AWF2_KAZAF|nr:hypothetical protein KAFR_0F01060 [Kazachstania africana CBS 2517]CCF58702.1 hypothetical protein KAFR_0F01060 [Kazachstania africana CBS 2517]
MDPYRNFKNNSTMYTHSQKQARQSNYPFSGYGSNVLQYDNNEMDIDKGLMSNASSSLNGERSPKYSPLDFSNPSYPVSHSQMQRPLRYFEASPHNSSNGSMGITSFKGFTNGNMDVGGQNPANNNNGGGDNNNNNNSSNGYSFSRGGLPMSNMNLAPCNYESHYPLFGLDWSMDDFVCLGSYKEDSRNKLEIIYSADLLTWEKLTETNVTYPVSNIKWLPNQLHPRQLTTSSDSLRIWSLNDEVGTLDEQINLSLCKYNKLHNITNGTSVTSTSQILGEFPPVTSFDWNQTDTNLLISSSIDTTCIVWDLQSSNYVKTQLIAHDSEVYDVRFLTKSTQLFASCGGDGSVRVFDLRSLAHSTIIYEPPTNPVSNADLSQQQNALLRLEPSPTDANVIATFVSESNKILILDMRNSESPVLVLEGHKSAINQIKWHPTKRYILLSCSDDCQVLYWDLNSTFSGNTVASPSNNAENGSMTTENSSTTNGSAYPSSTEMQGMDDSKSSSNVSVKNVQFPNSFYSNKTQEINNIVWRPQRGDWFGCISGKSFQNVRSF